MKSMSVSIKGVKRRSKLNPNLVRGTIHTFGKKSVGKAINVIRENVDPDSFPAAIQTLGRIPRIRTSIRARLKNKSYKALSGFADIKPLEGLAECDWAVAIIEQHLESICECNHLITQYNESFLRSDLKRAEEILDEVEHIIGISLWLVEAKLALLQLSKGLTEQKEYTKSLNKVAPKSFVAFYGHLISERNEDQVTPARYISRIEKQIKFWDLKAGFSAYMKYLITGELPYSVESLMQILTHISTTTVWDLYEALIAVCIQLASTDTLKVEEKSKIVQLLTRLSKSGDARIDNIIWLLGGQTRNINRPSQTYWLSQSSFWRGEIAEAALLAKSEVEAQTLSIESIFLEAQCYAILEVSPPKDTTIKTRLVSLLTEVLSRGESFSRAVSDLHKMALNFRSVRLLTGIYAATQLSFAQNLTERKRLMSQFLAQSPYQSAALLALLPRVSARNLVDALESPNSQEADLLANEYMIGLISKETLQNTAALDPARLEELELKKQILSNNFDEVLEIAKCSNQNKSRFDVLQTGYYEVLALISSEQVIQAIERTSQLCSDDDVMQQVLPIKSVLGNKSLKDLRLYRSRISTPIIFDLLRRTEESDRARDNLRWSCDEFLTTNGVSRPSELRDIADRFDLKQLIYFLRRVCIQPILEWSRGIKSSRALDEERIEVCALLVELDPNNEQDYREEIKTLTAKLMVEEGVELIDRSRVFVDTEALSRWANRELKESYERYKELARASADSRETSIDEVLEVLLGANQNRIMAYLEIPSDEKTKLLFDLVESLKSEYLNHPEHGLDSFLSMRIRHGTLLGTLRGPLEEHRLISVRDGVSGNYKANDFWLSKIEDASPEKIGELAGIFSRFSENYDGIVENEIKPVLRIRGDNSPEGIFDLNPAFNTIFALINRTLGPDTSFDDFIHLVFAMFRQQLDQNLKVARKYLEGKIKQKFHMLFQSWQNELASSLEDWQYGELQDAITKAHLEVMVVLDSVVNWLYLDTLQPLLRVYSLDQALDIAIESTSRALRGVRPDVSKNCGHGNVTSDVVSEIADIIFICFDNAQKHSGLTEAPKVAVSVEYDVEGNLLWLIVDSSVEPSICTDVLLAKLARIRRMIEDGSYLHHVRIEGGSGFLKLKKIAAQHEHHDLHFEFVGTSLFRVTTVVSLRAIPATSFPS